MTSDSSAELLLSDFAARAHLRFYLFFFGEIEKLILSRFACHPCDSLDYPTNVRTPADLSFSPLMPQHRATYGSARDDSIHL
ncbi:uncharacterized protein ARMOST_14872 [Armillaria ostoyae]|uniref:Uncharacterized protein n=1 Tax=Armillaria ostoyae TaxID=47428 RepID=A0A284RRW6_ARMOS|nr:uncharacterized protein ARMOST_14872 [Armillaria ostoyae]